MTTVNMRRAALVPMMTTLKMRRASLVPNPASTALAKSGAILILADRAIVRDAQSARCTVEVKPARSGATPTLVAHLTAPDASSVQRATPGVTSSLATGNPVLLATSRAVSATISVRDPIALVCATGGLALMGSWHKASTAAGAHFAEDSAQKALPEVVTRIQPPLPSKPDELNLHPHPLFADILATTA